MVDAELFGGFIDIGIEHIDAVLAAVRHYFLNLVRLSEVGGKVGRLEFGRVVALEITGLVADPGIAGCVGLVEGILGEFFPVFPNLVQHLFRVAILHSTRHKLVFQGVKYVYLFLSHCFAQLVRLTLGEVCKLLGKKHDLLLIDRDSIGVPEEFLHRRQVVLYGLDALLPVHEVRNVVHRARPVEGVHRNEVLEAFRVQLPQPVHHSRGFELEHADRVAASVEFVGLPVVYRNGLDVYVYSVSFLYKVQAFVNDGEGVQAQEVHLEHSHVFNIVAVELGGPEFLFLAVFIHCFLVFGEADGDVVHQVSAAYDGGAGVHTHLAYASFQFLGVFEHLLHQGVSVRVLEYGLEFRHQPVAVLEGDLCIHLLQSHLEEFLNTLLLSGIVRIVYLYDFAYLPEAFFQLVQLWIEGIFLLHPLAQAVRDHFRETVGFLYAQVTDARHVLYGAFCRHRSEGDHPRDVVKAIVVLHILVGRVEVLEVHVYIRHADTVRIEESLEQELVFDRVQIGDPEAVGDYGTGCGATARAHHRAHCACRGNIVLNYEEVVREAHSANGLELEIDALALLVGKHFAVAYMRALVCKVTEVGNRAAELLATRIAVLVAASYVYYVLIFLKLRIYVGEEIRRQVEFRQHVAAVDFVALDFFGDFECIGYDFRVAREERLHFLFALQIFLLGVAQPLFVVYICVCRKAYKPVVGGTVFLAYEMHVVGRNHLHVHFFGEVEDGVVDDELFLIYLWGESGNLGAVGLHFQIIVFPEYILMPLYGLSCGVQVPVQYLARNLSCNAGGEAYEVAVIFLHNLVRNPRLVVVLSLNMPGGYDLHQVLVAIVILCQEYEVVVVPVVVVLQSVVVMARHINLAAQYGLHSRMFVRKLHEFLDAVHIAVVGDGKRRHSELFCPVKEFGYG